jgi:Biotin/lipoate A/B protein ligase family
MPEPLPADLAAALDATRERRGPFGQSISYFAEATSTNDIAATLAAAGAPEGTTVIAGAQTAGRGRLGRTWFSPPGAGLYMSVILRSREAAPYVTLAAGVAVAEGVRAATGLPLELKWPNAVWSRATPEDRGHSRRSIVVCRRCRLRRARRRCEPHARRVPTRYCRSRIVRRNGAGPSS